MSLSGSDCFFCQVASQKKNVEIIAKFEHCYAIKDQFPVANGHVLIIPYEHIKDWFSAPKVVQIDTMAAIEKLKLMLDAEYQPDGSNIGMNCGKAAGQTVMHLHLHLIPRYIDDMEDPRGGVRGVIPAKQKY